MTEQSRPTAAADGGVLGAITNGIVSLHKATCGRGPTDAATHASNGTLLCVMRGVLTHADQTLVGRGEEEFVRRQRERLHLAMRFDAKNVVEKHTGRRVATVLHACEPADEVEAVIFVFADEDPFAGPSGS